jgi:hypothetical protein
MFSFFFSISGSLEAAEITTKQKSSDWLTTARNYYAKHPEDKGLGHIIRAYELLDGQVIFPHEMTLRKITKEGWETETPEIMSVLKSNTLALRAAVQATEAARPQFPPVLDVSSTIPNFLATQQITLLLLVDARRLEGSGHPDGAAFRSVQAVKFADLFCAKDQPVISHLVGIANAKMALQTLESILLNPELSPELLHTVGAELSKIDQDHVSIAEGFQAESKVLFSKLEKAFADPKEKQKLLKSLAGNSARTQEVEAILNDWVTLEKEYYRIWSVIIEQANKPYWERRQFEKPYSQTISTNPLFDLTIPNLTEGSIRQDVMKVHLRFAQVRCAIRLGKEDLIQQFLDPFTGQPLKVSPKLIYSMGPDQSDQKGTIAYDPTNGTISGGDIVIER